MPRKFFRRYVPDAEAVRSKRLVVAFGGGADAALVPQFEMDWAHWVDSMWRLLDWTLALGKPLALGLAALAITLAGIGYIAVQLAWRLYVVAAWRARRKRREGR